MLAIDKNFYISKTIHGLCTIRIESWKPNMVVIRADMPYQFIKETIVANDLNILFRKLKYFLKVCLKAT